MFVLIGIYTNHFFVYHGLCLERHPDLSVIGQNKSAANANPVYRAKRAANAADSDNNNFSVPKKTNTRKNQQTGCG